MVKVHWLGLQFEVQNVVSLFMGGKMPQISNLHEEACLI